jgi:hypothetical protein
MVFFSVFHDRKRERKATYIGGRGGGSGCREKKREEIGSRY